MDNLCRIKCTDADTRIIARTSGPPGQVASCEPPNYIGLFK